MQGMGAQGLRAETTCATSPGIPFTIHYSQFTIIKGTTRSTLGVLSAVGFSFGR
jgi:hypothetical protein